MVTCGYKFAERTEPPVTDMKKLSKLLSFLTLSMLLVVPSACSSTGPTNPPPLPQGLAMSSLLPDFVSVLDTAKLSVVAIDTEIHTTDIYNNPILEDAAGSGWVYDIDGGNSLIVTNNHVVGGATKIVVTLTDGTTFPGTILGLDPLTDLAVVRVNAKLTKLSIADPATLKVGQWVLTVGNSLGMGITAKEGIISRMGVDLQTSTSQMYFNLIETSAIINPGNSGGPLINMSNEVIGINSLKISTSGVEGMGYAINIKEALPIIKELVKTGCIPRPWTGIVGTDIDTSIQQTFDLPTNKGIIIVNVAPDSPAAKAGIIMGDVVTAINGNLILDSDDYDNAMDSFQNGDEISLTFYHSGSKKTIKLTLVQNPSCPL